MKLIYALLLNILFASNLNGQHAPYRIFNTHNGLPQIQVTAIFQDVHGYIWVGTKAGLVQYNGEYFRQYLSNEHIYSIANDAQGHLFVKASKGLYRFNGKQFSILYESKQAFQVLVSHHDYFLFSKSQIKHYRDNTLQKEFQVGIDFPVGGIQSLAFDVTSNSLYCTGTVADDIYKLSGTTFTSVYTAPDGWKVNVGHLSQEQPVIMINRNGEIRFLSLPTGKHLFTCWIAENRIKKMEVYHLPMRQYLHAYMYDYYRLDSATNSARKIELDFVKGPYPVLNDRDNNLWIGSDNGLYQVWERPFKTYPGTFMRDFWTLIEGDNQKLYGAAFKQGLYELDLEQQKKSEIYAPGPFSDAERDYYYGASKDLSGHLYFPSHYGLVKYYNNKAEKITKDICLISKYDTFRQQVVFGKQHGLGFVQANGHISYAVDNSNELVQSHPVSLVFTDSAIWVGTGKSLALYHRNKKVFRNIKTQTGEVLKGGIISMTRDEEGNVWLGGRKGLFVYRNDKQCFQKLPINYSGFITALTVPNDELLLLGTTREILVFKHKDFLKTGKLMVKTYNFRNGLIAQEIAQNGFTKYEDKILFPSTTNTTILDLEKISFESEFFDVAITKFNSSALPYSARYGDAPLHLEGGANDLEFEFESVGFGLPTKPVYKYRLSAWKSEWSDWSENDYANFNNLPSGEYTFEVAVKPALISQSDSVKTAKVIVHISMPFYKEPHFYKYAFFVLLILSLGMAYIARSRYNYKVKAIEHERKKRYLEIASLQANLNPHFIFNLLASVQNLVTQHQPEVANQYIIKFSRLIRAYMEATIKSSQLVESSNENTEITVKEEVDLLKMYIEFEQIKYRGKAFEYELELEHPDLLNKTIPPMILQPFVENAIKHGLYPSADDGRLIVHFSSEHDALVCTVADNGIGRKQSETLKRNSIKVYESRGLELINKRIKILNELGYHIRIEYEDPEYGGTIVKITFNY